MGAEALAATASAANALTNYATASGEISNLNLDVAGLQAGVGLLESTLQMTYMGAGPVMWEVKAQVTFDDPTRQYQSWSQNHCSVRLMRFSSSDSTTVQMAVAESFEGEVTHLTVSHY